MGRINFLVDEFGRFMRCWFIKVLGWLLQNKAEADRGGL